MAKLIIPCPKCNSHTTDLYRERGFSTKGFPFDAVFHCMCCGHRLYGQAAVKLAENVVTAQEQAAAEKAAAVEQAKKEAAARAVAQARAQEAAAKAARVKAAKKTSSSPPVAAPVEGAPLKLCAWHRCTKGPDGTRMVARPNSKYCSRDCSNKNARWRYTQREAEA